MSQSLVFGYIRHIEQIVLKHLIPQPIYQLCFQYYLNATILYFITPTTSTAPQIHVVDIDNHPTNTWKCKIKKGIIKQNDLLSYSAQDLKVTGICHGKGIQLPQYISNKLNLSNTLCNIIFMCGTTKLSKHCSAIILDQYSLSRISLQNDCTFKSKSGYHWNLPSFPKVVSGNDLIFSKKYGLLFIGGSDSSKQVHKLSFHNKAYLTQNNQWRWKRLHKNMKYGRLRPSSVMIGDNDTEKLMVVGGINFSNSKSLQAVEIYDFQIKKWKHLKSMNHQRWHSGIYFDKETDNVYVGGGRKVKKKVEFYNIKKNKWYNLCDTILEHKIGPIFWKDKFDDNLLYIASTNGHGIEYIDLRKSNNGWTTIYEPNCHKKDSLQTAFNIPINHIDGCHYLLK